MPSLTPNANPFALLLDPQAVLASIEHSDRLERLHRRVCRPLDKPVLPNAPAGTDARAFDQAVDDSADDMN
ncbi:MAG: hypothetical protein HY855_19185 [Burkholderiales bacterium]|nr:hypothetical protein [Burkholderiales bacterium]